MDLLRFSTAGSVDDGKSTLIGRLLFDSKGVFEDQLEAARLATRSESVGEVDLSLLTDGLRAEREQGITIDVAYRYFATPKRKFIIADTPGHEQYTRNMATGASTTEASVILVDARKGVQLQSRRHAYIAHLLGVRHLVVAVNKMDLVEFDQAVFNNIERDMRTFLADLGTTELMVIPVSALNGDNVVTRSRQMPWYGGPNLLEHLESVDVTDDENLHDFRFPVQLVLRPNADFRAYAGDVAAGVVRPGDEVTVLPSGKRSRIKRIHTADGDLAEAFAPMSIALQLEDELDISRGDMLVHSGNEPQVAQSVQADVVWMDERPLVAGRPYLIKHATRTVRANFDSIDHRVDVISLDKQETTQLSLNEIGRITLSFAEPLVFDPYRQSRRTGSFIVIDLETNNTVAAGMISEDQPTASHSRFWSKSRVDRNLRQELNRHRSGVVWLTGLPGAGKHDIAHLLERKLFDQGVNVYTLDGDGLRDGLSNDVGFSAADRSEHLRRAAEVAKVLVDAGHLVIASFVSPLAAQRETAKAIIGEADYFEIYAEASPSHEPRDPHGHFLRAKAEEDAQEIDVPYEAPTAPQLTVQSDHDDPQAAAQAIIELLKDHGVLGERRIH